MEVRPYSPRDRVFRTFVDRRETRDPALVAQASDIISLIRKNGMDALLEQERRFGCPAIDMKTLRVSSEEIADARNQTAESFLTALSLARVNMRKFHEYQRKRGYLHDDGDDVVLARRTRPLKRIGILNTGSVSDLLAYVVPAQVAGVGTIALSVPPDKDGGLPSLILAAAKILGVEEVYRLSGAQAVAAFAHGVPPMERVDKIVGHGGEMAEAAKCIVDAFVGVRRETDADELVIVADSSANAKFIASDFIAQAECGKNSLAVLLTTDRLLAEAVRIEMDRMIESLPDSVNLRETIDTRCGLFVCPSLTAAVDAANALSPARLGLQTRDNEELVTDVETAGTVYMGGWTCLVGTEAFSGMNPVSPGWGQARFSSGPVVDDFIQEMNVMEYGPERLLVAGRHIMELANADRRPLRAEAVRERLDLIRLSEEWKGR